MKNEERPYCRNCREVFYEQEYKFCPYCSKKLFVIDTSKVNFEDWAKGKDLTKRS